MHGPVCSSSWFTGHRVLSFGARAIVRKVLMHGPLCARSSRTGHCVLGPSPRAVAF